jgi:uncharacterized protein YodC (DUF2158 family)
MKGAGHGNQSRDKVKLRSGGPVMIATLVVGGPPPWPQTGHGSVECQWLVQDVLQTGVFDPAALDRVE